MNSDTEAETERDLEPPSVEEVIKHFSREIPQEELSMLYLHPNMKREVKLTEKDKSKFGMSQNGKNIPEDIYLKKIIEAINV